VRQHDTAGHAVARPALHALDRALAGADVGQVLHADALALAAVAGVAGEVVGTGAVIDDLLAGFVGVAHARVIERHGDLHVLRVRGDVGDEVGDVRGAAVVLGLERLLGDVVELEALLFDHAPDDAPLGIHHGVGIGEPAWHGDIGALDDAEALAEIAALGERDVLRPALLLPQFLAFHFEQLGGIGVFHLRPELLELPGGFVGCLDG